MDRKQEYIAPEIEITDLTAQVHMLDIDGEGSNINDDPFAPNDN